MRIVNYFANNQVQSVAYLIRYMTQYM